MDDEMRKQFERCVEKETVRSRQRCLIFLTLGKYTYQYYGFAQSRPYFQFHCRTEPDHFRKHGLWKGPTKSEFQQIPEYNINYKINHYSLLRWSADNNWTRTCSLHLHNPLPRPHPDIGGYCSERGVTHGDIHCGRLERWGHLTRGY